MKHTKYPELKAELKELAKEIKALKIRRDNWWDYKHELPSFHQNQVQAVFMSRAAAKSWWFRHKHIAYCMLRGRNYDEIEKPRFYNKPDMARVYNIMKEHEQKTESRTV